MLFECPPNLIACFAPEKLPSSYASRSTVYRWFWEGALKGVKLAHGTVRIFQSSLSEYLSRAE